MVLPGYVVPGQLVCARTDKDFRKYSCGSGLKEAENGIVATILGKLSATNSGAGKWQLTVTNEFKNPYAQIPSESGGNSRRSTSQLPQVGDIVYARVQRLGRQQVNLDIVAVENKGNSVTDSAVGVSASAVGSVHLSSGAGANERAAELGEGYGAIIRIQDIRATERDKIKVQQQFAPGDVVRASVLSLGDGSHYYLSTIHSDLGVVFARNPLTGSQLVPLDWQTMVDPKTSETFMRKCANPFVS